MKRKQPETPKNIRWSIASCNGQLWCIEEKQVPVTMMMDVIWSGEATHITAAYRAARSAGVPIYLNNRGEFRLRSKKAEE